MSIRHYKIVLTTVGPVHIGNGESYGKKDYFKLDDRRVGVLDAPSFVGRLSASELDEYCRFLETDSRASLQDYLDRHPNLRTVARQCVAYQIETPLAKARRGSLQYFDVRQFIKDSHGCPYVPGSSVKGMLRTALLVHLIERNRADYAALYDSSKATGRDRGSACKVIERKAFWRECVSNGEDTTINDIMRYVSVSDSKPLSTGDLVFVKKYDRFAKSDSGRHKRAMGNISRDPSYFEGNALNIYRECIRPGARIEVALDVDERIDGFLEGTSLDLEGIVAVLESSFGLYKRCFLDSFSLDGGASEGGGTAKGDGLCRYVYASGPLAGRRCRNRAVGDTGYCNTHKEHAVNTGKSVTCHLGGGVDFDSKTVINALFEDDRARVRETSRILYSQFPTKVDPTIFGGLGGRVREAGFEVQRMRAIRRNGRLIRGKDDHRHWEDQELGVSPHTAKLGILGSKKLPMGRCKLDIEEDR